nr:hypothetical protein CFP56_44481 [Quercus suber]
MEDTNERRRASSDLCRWKKNLPTAAKGRSLEWGTPSRNSALELLSRRPPSGGKVLENKDPKPDEFKRRAYHANRIQWNILAKQFCPVDKEKKEDGILLSGNVKQASSSRRNPQMQGRRSHIPSARTVQAGNDRIVIREIRSGGMDSLCSRRRYDLANENSVEMVGVISYDFIRYRCRCSAAGSSRPLFGVFRSPAFLRWHGGLVAKAFCNVVTVKSVRFVGVLCLDLAVFGVRALRRDDQVMHCRKGTCLVKQ